MLGSGLEDVCSISGRYAELGTPQRWACRSRNCKYRSAPICWQGDCCLTPHLFLTQAIEFGITIVRSTNSILPCQWHDHYFCFDVFSSLMCSFSFLECSDCEAYVALHSASELGQDNGRCVAEITTLTASYLCKTCSECLSLFHFSSHCQLDVFLHLYFWCMAHH